MNFVSPLEAIGRPSMTTPPQRIGADLPLVDLSRNTRIPVLMELTDALSKAQSPQQVLEAIILAMRKAYGPRCYISLSTAGLDNGHFRITRWLEVDGTERVRSGDPWGGAAGGLGDLPAKYGGVLTRLIATPEPKLVQNMAVLSDPIVGETFAKFGSLMAVPVVVEGQVSNWTIILHEEPHGLGVADLEQLIPRKPHRYDDEQRADRQPPARGDGLDPARGGPHCADPAVAAPAVVAEHSRRVDCEQI